MSNDDYFAGAARSSPVMISDTVNQMLASQRRRRPRDTGAALRNTYWALRLGGLLGRTVGWFLNPWC